MAGYSGTPLWKKLGIKPGFRIQVENEPENYRSLLEPLPEGVTFARARSGRIDMVHVFASEATGLAAKLEAYRQRIAPDGMIWVSWPKKSAKVPTDVTEDVIRALALPLGLVDIKVCAVDEVWSGLKLVIRLEKRNSTR